MNLDNGVISQQTKAVFNQNMIRGYLVVVHLRLLGCTVIASCQAPVLLCPAGCSTARTRRRPIVRPAVRTTAVTASSTPPTSGRAFSGRSQIDAMMCNAHHARSAVMGGGLGAAAPPPSARRISGVVANNTTLVLWAHPRAHKKVSAPRTGYKDPMAVADQVRNDNRPP